MLLHLSDPTLVPELVRALRQRVSYVVEERASGHVAVSVLGSFADGGKLNLTHVLATWRTTHPHVSVELLDESQVVRPPLRLVADSRTASVHRDAPDAVALDA